MSDGTVSGVETNGAAGGRHTGAHLIVTVTGDPDARLPHLHVHNQTLHHRQSVLVVTEVLKQGWKIWFLFH